jgi:regulatory protein
VSTLRRGRAEAGAGSSAPTEAEEKRALDTALRALARRGFTAFEMAARLSARGFDPDPIATAITRLREIGYLDEAAVADAVLRDALRRHRGSRRVAQVLARRGVAAELAERALRESEDADLDGARSLVAKRFPGGIGSPPGARARAFRLLVARGYPPDVARRALGVRCDD